MQELNHLSLSSSAAEGSRPELRLQLQESRALLQQCLSILCTTTNLYAVNFGPLDNIEHLDIIQALLNDKNALPKDWFRRRETSLPLSVPPTSADGAANHRPGDVRSSNRTSSSSSSSNNNRSSANTNATSYATPEAAAQEERHTSGAHAAANADAAATAAATAPAAAAAGDRHTSEGVPPIGPAAAAGTAAGTAPAAGGAPAAAAAAKRTGEGVKQQPPYPQLLLLPRSRRGSQAGEEATVNHQEEIAERNSNRSSVFSDVLLMPRKQSKNTHERSIGGEDKLIRVSYLFSPGLAVYYPRV